MKLPLLLALGLMAPVAAAQQPAPKRQKPGVLECFADAATIDDEMLLFISQWQPTIDPVKLRELRTILDYYYDQGATPTHQGGAAFVIAVNNADWHLFHGLLIFDLSQADNLAFQDTLNNALFPALIRAHKFDVVRKMCEKMVHIYPEILTTLLTQESIEPGFALYIAASQGFHDLVKTIIQKHKLEVPFLNTALLFGAAAHGDKAGIDLLIKLGASSAITNKQEDEPRLAYTEWFIEPGDYYTDILVQAIESRSLSCVHYLLQTFEPKKLFNLHAAIKAALHQDFFDVAKTLLTIDSTLFDSPEAQKAAYQTQSKEIIDLMVNRAKKLINPEESAQYVSEDLFVDIQKQVVINPQKALQALLLSQRAQPKLIPAMLARGAQTRDALLAGLNAHSVVPENLEMLIKHDPEAAHEIYREKLNAKQRVALVTPLNYQTLKKLFRLVPPTMPSLYSKLLLAAYDHQDADFFVQLLQFGSATNNSQTTLLSCLSQPDRKRLVVTEQLTPDFARLMKLFCDHHTLAYCSNPLNFIIEHWADTQALQHSFILACMLNHQECIKLIAETVSQATFEFLINSFGPGNWTPLMVAARWGHKGIVNMLLSHEAKGAAHALALAVKHHHHEIAASIVLDTNCQAYL